MEKMEKILTILEEILVSIPFAARAALRAGAGAAGEQTADHGGGESGEANPPQLNPPAPALRRSGTDKGAAKQQ